VTNAMKTQCFCAEPKYVQSIDFAQRLNGDELRLDWFYYQVGRSEASLL